VRVKERSEAERGRASLIHLFDVAHQLQARVMDQNFERQDVRMRIHIYKYVRSESEGVSFIYSILLINCNALQRTAAHHITHQLRAREME